MIATSNWPLIASAIATVALAALTTVYVIITGRIVKHTRRQADLLERRDAQQAKRAARAICCELRVNLLVLEDSNVALLDSAFSSGSWALTEIPIELWTVRTLGLTYAMIRHSNESRLTSAVSVDDRQRAWDAAAKAVSEAVDRIAEDAELVAFLDDPAPEAPATP